MPERWSALYVGKNMLESLEPWLAKWDDSRDMSHRVTTRVPCADYFEIRDQALIAHATQDRFVFRHVWHPHDVVLWDNRRTMHRATADYGDARREMLRVLLRG